jgi:hypothetical protein
MAKNNMLKPWEPTHFEKEFQWRKKYPWIAVEKNDRLAWNKLAKALHSQNDDITSVWHTHRDDHFGEFVGRILGQVKEGRISLTDIGRIEAHDDGSRGTAQTMHMQLWNVTHTAILDVAHCHTYKYYYM